MPTYNNMLCIGYTKLLILSALPMLCIHISTIYTHQFSKLNFALNQAQKGKHKREYKRKEDRDKHRITIQSSHFTNIHTKGVSEEQRDSWTDSYRAEELNELADVRQIEEHPRPVGAVQYYRPKRPLLSSHFFLLLLLPPQPSLLNICLCSFNMLLHIRRVDQPQVKGEFPLPFARGCPNTVVDLRRIGWLP